MDIQFLLRNEGGEALVALQQFRKPRVFRAVHVWDIVLPVLGLCSAVCHQILAENDALLLFRAPDHLIAVPQLAVVSRLLYGGHHVRLQPVLLLAFQRIVGDVEKDGAIAQGGEVGEYVGLELSAPFYGKA